MDKETAQTRLDATREQISRIEGLIKNAPSTRDEMSAGMYSAMVSGYESQLEDLRKDEQTYLQALN